MSALRVLVLVHQDCVPPQGATVKLADWAHWKTEFYVIRSLKKRGHQVRVLPVAENLLDLQTQINAFNPHVAFNLLEEFQGQAQFESHIVSFLELMAIPYTGCNPLGLAIGRNKALSKQLVQGQGLLTPQFLTVAVGQKWERPKDLRFPLIVKSLNEEASLGISQKSVVHNDRQLLERVKFIHQSIGTPALVEEYILGREFYVGVLGNKRLQTFEPWELIFGDLKKEGVPIATRQVKFNQAYCEKHGITRGRANNLSPFISKQLSKLSSKIYTILKLSGYARMDFRVTDRGQIYFLEANPNPELAKHECFANGAQAKGLRYDDLIDKIISLGKQSLKRAA